ncbi:MAG: hydroxymethylbilane synthase [Piscirickettsiaceae bacterium]|nr:hydroxymethylbilane synthase [Piscirickettsiaceae bacterium]
MINKIVKIATRKSPLAIWQAKFVHDALLALYPNLQIILLKMSTQGDKILDTPLAKIGGKGLFVKELEQSMLLGNADIAVHSMKDVPVKLHEGLHVPVICKREDPFDAFVSNSYQFIDDLPQGARVGTSSLRRECQLRSYRPDLNIIPLRGNVNTRLKKLDKGDYDAIILATAGLRRLKFTNRIKSKLTLSQILPAIGQGALGIETRIDDDAVNSLIAPLLCSKTWIVISAERAMNRRLSGGCQIPIAGFASVRSGKIRIRGLVGRPDGIEILHAEITGKVEDAESLGTALAEQLLAQGADKILANIYIV